MDIAEMTELWAQFVFEDKLSPKIRTPIAESWKKCKAAGVNPGGGKGRHIDETVLASVRKENRLSLCFRNRCSTTRSSMRLIRRNRRR